MVKAIAFVAMPDTPRARTDRSFAGARIAGFYAASLLLATLLLGAATYFFAARTIGHELDARIRGEMETLLRADAREGRAALIADIMARAAVPGLDGGYALHDAHGNRLAGLPITQAPGPGWSNPRFTEPDGDRDVGRALTVRLGDGDTLTVIEDTASLNRIRTALLGVFTLGFGLMLTLAIGGGNWLGAAIRGRLGALDDAARAIIEGDMRRRMPVNPGGDEFDRLSRTLNLMLDRMAMLLDNLRHVSDDIAHDLRSPLMRLRGTLELAVNAGHEPVPRSVIEDAIGRVDEILTLFAAILRISELEAGAVRHHFTSLALDRLVADVAEAYAPAAEDCGHRLACAPMAPTRITGDRELIAQAVANLIDNALKHTPPGTRITLTLSDAADGVAEIIVRDDGPGIPIVEHGEALRRFGRGSQARSGSGHGLGLNLASAVAVAHRGALVLDDAAPGLIARLRLAREG